jgi:hypothetical protein
MECYGLDSSGSGKDQLRDLVSTVMNLERGIECSGSMNFWETVLEPRDRRLLKNDSSP